MQLANEAIRDDISVETFRTDAVVAKLQSDKAALQQLVADAGRLPSRAALLSDPNGRNDKLLDALNEAQKRNDPAGKYRAIQALKKAREENQ